MRDRLSESRILLLHPAVREVFKSFIEKCENDLNITLRIVQGLRTVSEQNMLYAQGRTSPGDIVTDAPGGMSYHNYGLAVDLVPIDEHGKPQWNFNFSKIAAETAGSFNFTWGGNFKRKDYDHFECSFGHTTQQLFDKYENGDVTNGYVNL